MHCQQLTGCLQELVLGRRITLTAGEKCQCSNSPYCLPSTGLRLFLLFIASSR